MWSLRSRYSSEHDTYLVLTFVGETRLLALNEQEVMNGWMDGLLVGWSVDWVGGWVGAGVVGEVWVFMTSGLQETRVLVVNQEQVGWRGVTRDVGEIIRRMAVEATAVATPRFPVAVHLHPPKGCTRRSVPVGNHYARVWLWHAMAVYHMKVCMSAPGPLDYPSQELDEAVLPGFDDSAQTLWCGNTATDHLVQVGA